ncbi:beta-ketoacyl synthase N-terminal-like domain-containing protein [Aquimarina rhabdastrellae]
MANRVSYFLNLHGPSMTLDTMCSSSLTAIHLACQDLKEGRTDLGIAGGVNVSVHPNKYLMLSTGQFISSDGHCQSFGEGGDGYIPGEGVGTVILKRLSEAERDGNHIYGIIKGSSLNHGGKTNGYSVPNPKAQADAIRQALAVSGTDPRHISYIEAHGTGTKLGDPIEISALTKAFEGATDDIKTGYCQIGSAKSNIGHCESAAGIAGVTKVLLQMRYRQIVPSLHSSRLNPHIDFDKTPFIVNQKLRDWDAPVLNGKELPRIAGISSFGAGGSNAHLIIEEYIGSEIPSFNGSNSEFMIPLSAKKPLQLEQKVNDLLDFLRFSNKEEDSLELRAMSYTLQVGRESMDERVGFVVSSIDELIQKLESYLKGTDDITDIYRGQVKRDRDLLSGYATGGLDLEQMVRQWIKDRNYASLIEVWSKGQDIDWQRLYVNTHPKLMSLPTYPFARERYWIDIVDSKESIKGKVTSVLHPLLHRNISDLSHQVYSSTFIGDEFYTLGSGKNELSVPVYLEMAKAALADSLPEKESFITVEFRDVVWTGPVGIKEDLRVAIALLPQREEVIDFEIYHPEGEEELVYCQGSSVISTGSSKAVLDIVELKRRIGNEGINSAYDLSLSEVVSVYDNKEELLIALTLPESLISGEDIYRLDPTMFENALQLGGRLLSGGDHQIFIPIEIASLKVIDSCSREMIIWIRPSNQTDTLDIDLCNKQGEVCVQAYGVSYEEEVETLEKRPVRGQETSEVSLPSKEVIKLPKELPIPVRVLNTKDNTVISSDKDLDNVLVSKPANILLQPIKDLPTTVIGSAVAPKAQFILQTSLRMNLGSNDSKIVSDIKLYDKGEGVYSLEVATEQDNLLSEELIGDLVHSLNYVKDLPGLKVLIVRGTNKTFLQGDRNSYNECLTQGLYHTVASFPYPVIAEMQGDAMGAGFLLGALCDFMICSETSRYKYTNPKQGLFPTIKEEFLFEERFGINIARSFLYNIGTETGANLKGKGWNIPIVTLDQVGSYTEDLVRSLSEKPQNSLRLLKQHLIRGIAKQVTELKQVNTFKTEESLAGLETKLTTRSKYIQLETSIEGVLTVKIDTGSKNYKLKTLISGISEVLDQVEKTPVYKVIILSSVDEGFLRVSDLSTSLEEIRQLQDILINASVPVIATLEGNARDLGWLIAQSCDVCIYHTDGIYCASELVGVPELGRLSLPFFNRGLGYSLSQEILLTGREYSGSDLEEHTGSVLVSSDPMTEVLEQAGYWSSLPLEVIRNWKKVQASELRSVLEELPLWTIKEEEVTTFPDEPTRIALQSEVIKAILHPEGIVEIIMEDREARNMFSDAFIEGMIEVFDHISESSTYKVVVLTGYDSYFASGGTKESLVAIQEGKARFTDTRIFQLALDCNIPVIAVMQGHGIGAGWSMGMFSDFPILSKESHYVSPYMNYGFTPGAGATLIFPERIGHDLARGTLLTGVEYAGQTLKEKRISLPVVSRKEISEFAFTLVRDLVRNSRSSLIAFKDQMTRYIKDRLEDICAQELSMHDKTFVGSLDTLKRIEGNFNTTSASRKDRLPLINTVVSTPEPVSQGKYTLPMIIADLKTLLAGELHLEEEEIDEDSQFVDLGLDSIVGVTFIRKINEKFGISLQATIIYSYATLSALSSYVLEETGQEEKEEVALVEQPVSTIASTKVVTTGIRKQSDILSDLRGLLAAELHLEEEEIDEDSQFVDLGLDSIVGVTFIRKINEKFGITLQATIVYSYATLLSLSEYIQGELGVEEEEVHPPVVNSLKKEKTVQVKQFTRRVLTSIRKGRSSLRTTSNREKDSIGGIAIIGMSGQFPKAGDVDVFWQNIAEGRDCISEIPGDRWDIDHYYQAGDATPGKTYSKWMGALEGYDLFDPMFFNISPVEAESMDPQQRLFLQSCWHTMENSGYNPHSFSGSKCGVYVGCAAGDYLQQSKKHQLSAQGFTGAAGSILAARISYFLNLQGPCISMDTACSSSLVAIANACDALVSGSIDAALAGGVYVMATPSMHIMSSQSGMLSPDGKCHTFDQQANGFVPGEGVGAVMLKRVEDAEKDGDNILGLIRGWGVNQDGKTNGITAPNTESQTQLEQQVYDQFDIDPNSIQLIEAHGTGTKLGDPIEIEGLRKTFKKYTQEKEYCALGSVKSNIGHCLTAAGVAGVIKVVQSLKHQQLPPTINFEQLNEHINLDDSPFYVNTKLRDWKVKEGQQRQAAISSFGFSGTNAHLVLQEYIPDSGKVTQKPVQVVKENGAFMIPLSARSEEQLQQKASNLLRFIEERKGSLDLIEVGYTLQEGREAMEERLGLMIREENELIEKLQDYIQGKENISGVYRGQVKRNKEGLRIISHDVEMRDTIVEKYIDQQKLSKLLDLWVKGLEFDWNKLYSSKPKRISLPVYPFAKERYWIEETIGNTIKEKERNIEVLHPLVHKNISDLRQQCYNTIYNEEKYFVQSDDFPGYKFISSMALLEMARAAVFLANPPQKESEVIELSNISWGYPVEIKKETEVRTTLFGSSPSGVEIEKVDFEIHIAENEEELTFLRGSTFYSQNIETPKKDLEQLKSQMNKVLSGTKDNNKLSKDPVTAIYLGEDQLLAEITTSFFENEDQEDLILHPEGMESILQVSKNLFPELKSSELYPVSLDYLKVWSALTGDIVVWARSKDLGEMNHKLDIDILDQKGNISVQIKGLSVQEFNKEESLIEVDEVIENIIDTKQENIIKQPEELSQHLYYREYWKEEPLTLDESYIKNKQLVIFADEEFRKRVIKEDDEEKFAQSIYVYQNSKYNEVSNKIYHCRFNNIIDVKKILNDVERKSKKPIQLIYTWAKDQGEKGVHALFNLFKAVKESNHHIDVTLVGHYEPTSVDSCWDYSWIGFERSLKMVLPNNQVSILYTNTHSCTLNQLTDIKQHSGIIRYKDQQRFILSYNLIDNDNIVNESILQKNGGYLITGGMGELGFQFAKFLAKEYQAKLLLLGRTSLNSEIEKKVDQLKQEGAQEVHYSSLDISNKKAMTSLGKNLPISITGVIHAAGVESEEIFHEKKIKSIDKVLRSKSKGTLLLEEVLEGQPLDFVCYFSSSAALLGDFGSCDYAIANRFLMAYAQYRQQKKLGKGKTLVINWPFWKEGGMGKRDTEQAEFYLKSSGQEVLNTAEGIEIWKNLLQTDQLQTMVLKGKPDRTKQFMDRVYTVDQEEEPSSKVQNILPYTGKGWNIQYQDFSLGKCAYSDLIKQVSISLKIPVSKLDGITNLVDYGFDSISLTTFAKQLNEYFLLNLTPSIFYNYPTIEKLSEYLVNEYHSHFEMFYSKPSDLINDKKHVEKIKFERDKIRFKKRFIQSRSNNTSGTFGLSREPIAIIGMSGRFPKANDVDQFWSMLENGESGIEQIPLSRWDWRDYFINPGNTNNKINTNKGGFINNIEGFDPLFFEITPREAEAMDPGQRMLLMEAYKAIEDAQINPSSLRGTSTGVFVGMEESQYDSLVSGEQGVGNSGNAMISSRLSYFLDLHGPTISTNTACSSGLVALHQAILSLRNEECESALVAGISSLILSPEFYTKMSQAGMLSQDGECYSFAKKANGIGAGEAVAVLMLKPLSKAVQDGNRIYGTIKASGINFDGKTNGVTAPNGKSQEELIKNTYAKYDINPNDISHIVAHGTGTKLGDPIELNALNDAFKKLNKEQPPTKKGSCAITSIKSNLGHTMAASGLVSVIGLLKGLEHEKIPATINCDEENDYINWEDSPFYINKKTTQWIKEPGKPRMGGVSSFGRSGTNAHVVIEEYNSKKTEDKTSVNNPQDDTRVIVVLSAKTEEQLKQKKQDLLQLIDSRNKNVDLASLAYSLQITREIFKIRLGLIVGSIEELTEKLESLLNENLSVENVYKGEVNPYDTSISLFNADTDLQGTIDKWIEGKKLSKLLELWVNGLELNWEMLYPSNTPRFMNLPKYPFDQERYWINKTTSEKVNGNLSIPVNGNYEIIENLIDQIESESIETEQGIDLLKKYSIH